MKPAGRRPSLKWNITIRCSRVAFRIRVPVPLYATYSSVFPCYPTAKAAYIIPMPCKRRHQIQKKGIPNLHRHHESVLIRPNERTKLSQCAQPSRFHAPRQTLAQRIAHIVEPTDHIPTLVLAPSALYPLFPRAPRELLARGFRHLPLPPQVRDHRLRRAQVP